jgi:hypothetical protein
MKKVLGTKWTPVFLVADTLTPPEATTAFAWLRVYHARRENAGRQRRRRRPDAGILRKRARRQGVSALRSETTMQLIRSMGRGQTGVMAMGAEVVADRTRLRIGMRVRHRAVNGSHL